MIDNINDRIKEKWYNERIEKKRKEENRKIEEIVFLISFSPINSFYIWTTYSDIKILFHNDYVWSSDLI